jgi:glycosyltransferase involved in cell wall biosynthesis
MSKPFFSVIVPAHNSAGYIEKGLESIEKQTFKDYELIVVCDACTDSTRSVATWYADKLIITNFGMDGLARNVGIDAAEGYWLIFMDDDDWFLHEYVFQQLHDAAIDTDADMLVFDFIWKGRGYYRNDGNTVNIAVWSKCWRRSLIGDTRFPAIPFTSDEPFMNEIIAKNPKGIFMKVPMYYYNYMRKGSQTEQHARPDGAVPEA